MITKTAELIKEALEPTTMGAGIGFTRASNLSKSEASQLKTQYGLSQNAHIGLRNAARGAAGGIAGGVAGGVAGGAAGLGLQKFAPKVLSKLGPWGSVAGLGLSAFGGFLGGATKATNKYSKSALPTNISKA